MNNRDNNYLVHWGVKGMHWYERKYQYKDGSLTPAGRVHYDVGPPREKGKEESTNSRRSVRLGSSKPSSRIKVRAGGSASAAEKAQADLLKQQAKLAKAKRKEYEKKQKEKREAAKKAEWKKEERERLLESLDTNKLATDWNKGKFTKEEYDNILNEIKEKDRQNILKSGDADKLLANRSKFSNEELQSALKNIKADRKTLEDFYELESKYKTKTLDKAEIDRRLKEDKEKEEILKSGDPTKLLENQAKFTTAELTEAMSRVKTKAGIDDLRREIEKRERQNKVDNALSGIEYIADLTLKTASVYEKIKEGKARWTAARSNWEELSLNDQLDQLGKGGVNSYQLNSLLNKANTVKAITSAVRGIKDTINNTDDNSSHSKNINEMTLPELTMAFAKGNLNKEDTELLNKRASDWGRLYESLNKMKQATGRNNNATAFDVENTKEYKDLEAELKRRTKDIQEIVNNAGSNNSSAANNNTPTSGNNTSSESNNNTTPEKKKGIFGFGGNSKKTESSKDTRSELEKLSDDVSVLNELESIIGDTSGRFTPSSSRNSSESSSNNSGSNSNNSGSSSEQKSITHDVKVGSNTYSFTSKESADYFKDSLKFINPNNKKAVRGLIAAANYRGTDAYKKALDSYNASQVASGEAAAEAAENLLDNFD